MRKAIDATVISASQPVWRCTCFDELTVTELYDILRARSAVFVVEQACPYQDCDDLDRFSHHLWTRFRGELAAYLRIVPPGVKYPEPSLGRIMTAAAVRGSGLGRALMREGIARCESLYGPQPIRIGAQRYLLRFYGDFGFEPTGLDYDEDGIPHAEMVRYSS
ncbi:MAG: GNAT family N-acetyltransferase, partial [Gemmatimonadaceae bacterium]